MEKTSAVGLLKLVELILVDKDDYDFDDNELVDIEDLPEDED